MPAKRKLDFGLTVTKKARKAAMPRGKKTLAAKIKSTIMRTLETKVQHLESKWESVTHNTVFTLAGVSTINTTNNSTSGSANLLYSVNSTGANDRNGEKLYSKRIDIEMMFGLPQNDYSAVTATYDYNTTTVIRVVVYEADAATTVGGTQVPSDLFLDPNIPYPTIGNGNDGTSGTYIMRPTNTRYRILKDSVYSNDIPHNNTESTFFWMGKNKYIRFSIPVNKNVSYSTVSNTVPDKVIGLCVIPYNNKLFGSGENLGIIKFSSMHYFKDI